MPVPNKANGEKLVADAAVMSVMPEEDEIEGQFRALEGSGVARLDAPQLRDVKTEAGSERSVLQQNAIGDCSESSVSNLTTPRSMASAVGSSVGLKKDRWATRPPVIPYDNALEKPPAIESTVVDVPFLPPPDSAKKKDPGGISMAALVSSPLLESTDSGRGHDKRAEPRSIYSSASSSAVSVTEARIRATAQQLVTEKAQSAKSSAAGTAVEENGGKITPSTSLPAKVLRHITSTPGGSVPSPQQEWQSKRDVEEMLSRLEGHSPPHRSNHDQQTFKPDLSPGDSETTVPVTEYSVRAGPGLTETPVTRFSARGKRTTGFSSLYSPRPRHRASLENMAGNGQSTVPITQFSSRSSPAARLEPLVVDDDSTPERPLALSAPPPKEWSVSTSVPGTGASKISQRRKMLNGLSSSDEDEVDKSEDELPRKFYYREISSDDESEMTKMPSSLHKLTKMTMKKLENEETNNHPVNGQTSYRAYKYPHRETSRRANGVSQAMRREWACQILGEVKTRYDVQNRGTRIPFREWKYETEIKNLHYHLLAMEVRRNERSLQRRFLQAWYTDANELTSFRNLAARERDKFKRRLFKAYLENWKLKTRRTKRQTRILYRVLLREASHCINFWKQEIMHRKWLRARIQRLRDRRERLTARNVLKGIMDVMRSKLHMRLFSNVLCRDLLSETTVFIHAWRDYVRGREQLFTSGRRCEQRRLVFEKYTAFHTWISTHDEKKLRRGMVHKADVHMWEVLMNKSFSDWLQGMNRLRFLAHSSSSILDRHERLLTKGAFGELHLFSASNRALRSNLTGLLARHMNMVLSGVMRKWFTLVYDVRMNFRSKMLNRFHIHKTLSSTLQAWNMLSVVNARTARKFKVLINKYRHGLQHAAFRGWKKQWLRVRNRRRKLGMALRLRLARMRKNHFQAWQRWTKSYTTRIIAVAGWAISRQDLKAVGGALKWWRFEIDQNKSLTCKAGRLRKVVNFRRLSLSMGRWQEAICHSVRRSIDFERARFRVNRAIQQSALGVWVHAHHTFCRKVHQLEKVVGKNARRYTREHLFAWRELVEYYSRREVLVQQNAIRRAYIIAADVLRRWKMLEGGHIVVGVDQLDRAQVLYMMAKQKRVTKCFLGIKSLLLTASVQNKTVASKCTKIAFRKQRDSFEAWKWSNDFSKYSNKVVEIFDRRMQIRFFHAWKLAHQQDRKWDRHSKRWDLHDKVVIFDMWRCLTITHKRAAIFLCRAEERHMREMVENWRKMVDIRKSLTLKFGLFRQKMLRDTRKLHACLQQFVYNLTYRRKMTQKHKLLRQRIALRKLTEATRHLHQESKDKARRKRKYARCVEMVRISNLKCCLNSWRRWVYTKRKALEAVDQIIDHM